MATSYGPLSEQMWPGTPRRVNSSESVAITSTAFSFRPILIVRHSRVNPSIKVAHAEAPSVVAAVLDEVVGPDMVGMFRPKPDAGVLVAPEPPALGLLVRNLQPLASPYPLDPLAVHDPAGSMQHCRDATIAVEATPIFYFTGCFVGRRASGMTTLPPDPAPVTLVIRDSQERNLRTRSTRIRLATAHSCIAVRSNKRHA
jgi:hypothetical protein